MRSQSATPSPVSSLHRPLGALALALAVAVLPACKQGLGERCQIDSDCAAGLVCSTGGDVPTCREEIGAVRDAGFPDAPPVLDAAIDAPVDAAPTDAPVDAPTDATTDAAAADVPGDT